MKIHLPFKDVSNTKLKWLFIISLIVTLILFQVMNVINQPLKNDIATLGIISFEFAGNITTAQEIIQSWDETTKIYTGISLGFDYLFLVSYALTIFVGCIFVTRSISWQSKILINFGAVLAYVQIIAAILDSIENYALIKILLGSQQNLYAILAYLCALPKFMIVVIGIIYLLLGFLIELIRKTKASKK